MTLRSQTVAMAVLFVALGLIFVLVADAGVSTSVFLPQPTLTYTPTVGPTPTPLPDPAAANWSEAGEGQLFYSADPNIAARIVHSVAGVADFATQAGLTPVPDDDPYPLLNLLGQIRTALEDQIAEAQLTVESDAFTGPIIELVNGVPVSELRLQIAPQTSGSGSAFPGLDLLQAFIDRGNGEMTAVQYILQGELNPVVYNDFRAWLAANVAELAGQAAEETTGEEQTATPAAEQDTTPAAEATQTPTGAKTGDQTATPAAEETAAPSPEPAITATPEPGSE